MGVDTSIWDQTTEAEMKTYLGGDERIDAEPPHNSDTDIGATEWNKLVAAVAELALRTLYGNLDSCRFSHPNVTASQTGVALYRGGGGDTAITEKVAPWPGSVVGLTVRVENARSAGTLTIKWTKDGSEQTLQVVIDATNDQQHYAVQLPKTEAFAAGDRIGAKFTTDGTWAAGATPSIDVDVHVEYEKASS